MKEYKVVFKLHIIGGNHSSGPGDIYLKHEMMLPFPPTDNYGYSDGKWSTDNARWEEKHNSQSSAEIQWDNDKQEFTFWVSEDRTVWYEDFLKQFPPGEKRDKAYEDCAKKQAKMYIEEYGWEIDESDI